MIKYSRVTTGPQVEPISLTEAKAHLKVDSSDENDLITLLIQAAREIVEDHTGRSLITQTRELKLDEFPCGDTIKLPNGRAQANTVVITYYDDDNVLQTLSSADYFVDTHSEIPRIVVEDNWPSTYDRPNAVTIEYDAGYGDASTDVPAALIAAMKLILGHLYSNREQVQPVNSFEIPFGAQVLMNPYVIVQDAYY